MIEATGRESATSVITQEFCGAAWPSKELEESPPRGTLQVSSAGYLRPRTSGSISQLNLKFPFDVFRFQGLYKY